MAPRCAVLSGTYSRPTAWRGSALRRRPSAHSAVSPGRPGPAARPVRERAHGCRMAAVGAFECHRQPARRRAFSGHLTAFSHPASVKCARGLSHGGLQRVAGGCRRIGLSHPLPRTAGAAEGLQRLPLHPAGPNRRRASARRRRPPAQWPSSGQRARRRASRPFHGLQPPDLRERARGQAQTAAYGGRRGNGLQRVARKARAAFPSSGQSDRRRASARRRRPSARLIASEQPTRRRAFSGRLTASSRRASGPRSPPSRWRPQRVASDRRRVRLNWGSRRGEGPSATLSWPSAAWPQRTRWRAVA